MDNEKTCVQIMNLSPKIRFVGMLGHSGNVLASIERDDVVSLLTPQESKMSFHYAQQRWDMRRNLTHKIGRERYSLTEYAKVKQISIPISEKILLMISLDIESEHTSILNKILEIVSKITS